MIEYHVSRHSHPRREPTPRSHATILAGVTAGLIAGPLNLGHRQRVRDLCRVPGALMAWAAWRMITGRRRLELDD
jgi:hypothetical protein